MYEKKKTITTLFALALTLLTACSSPARIVDKTQSSSTESPTESTTAPSTQTSTPAPSQSPSKNIESYDIQDKIASQVSGEMKDQFEYLVYHREDSQAHLEDIYLGYFTQNQNGEILATYHVEDSSKSENPTFFFILDVYTGQLLSSYYLTADKVELFLLDSPMGTKIFVTQNSILNGTPHSNATIYSCLSGEWLPSSALTEHNTMVQNPDLSLSGNYIYTFQNDILTVESQSLPETQEEEQEDTTEDTEDSIEDTEESIEDTEESTENSSSLQLYGTYSWNHDLSIFQRINT